MKYKGWFPKFATGLNIIISHSLKSIKVIELSFSQKDSLWEDHFGKRTAWLLPYFFEKWLIMIFSPVANFGNDPLLTFRFENPIFSLFWPPKSKSKDYFFLTFMLIITDAAMFWPCCPKDPKFRIPFHENPFNAGLDF